MIEDVAVSADDARFAYRIFHKSDYAIETELVSA